MVSFILIIQILSSLGIVIWIQYLITRIPLSTTKSNRTTLTNTTNPIGLKEHTNNDADKLHLRRRIQHLSTGLVFYFISFPLSRYLSFVLLSLASLLLYYLHHSTPYDGSNRRNLLQKWYHTTFISLFKLQEQGGIHSTTTTKTTTLPGAFYFLIGTAFLSIVPPIDIARTSLLCLSIADPMAAIGGILLSESSIKKNNPIPPVTLVYKPKTLVGSLCCFITTFSIVLFQSSTFDILEAFIGALSCSFLEGYICSKFPLLDDNVMIPIGTAMSIWFYRCVSSLKIISMMEL